MPPYSKLKEFMVEKYRAIAENPKATLDQQLKALGHLEGLQVKRKPRPRKANATSFKPWGVRKNEKAPKASDTKLLGAVPIDSGLSKPEPVIDSNLLGPVELTPKTLQ